MDVDFTAVIATIADLVVIIGAVLAFLAFVSGWVRIAWDKYVGPTLTKLGVSGLMVLLVIVSAAMNVAVAAQIGRMDGRLASGPPGLSRVLTGTIEVNYETNPDMRYGPSRGATGERGILAGQGRVDFGAPFSNPPAVTTGLTEIDIIDGANARLTFEVTQIDENGFNYSFVTWEDTMVHSAMMSWMAVGAEARP